MGFEVFKALEPLDGHAVILDNSVVMRWLVASANEEQQAYALAIRDGLREGMQPVVPYLWIYEASHVVSRYVSSNELTLENGTAAIRALYQLLSVMVVKESPVELMNFAATHNISAYDAAYILLAKQVRAPLATLDQQMRSVATDQGVHCLGV
ncbi:MAG: type II toxin-antitoxin system VapC family toxin [Halieaceae bacterium]|nr:type II toxin-antitoxin system VapC family toxin [Halieaceae bacterium]